MKKKDIAKKILVGLKFDFVKVVYWKLLEMTFVLLPIPFLELKNTMFLKKNRLLLELLQVLYSDGNILSRLRPDERWIVYGRNVRMVL